MRILRYLPGVLIAAQLIAAAIPSLAADVSAAKAGVPNIDAKLGSAYVRANGAELDVSTGWIRRTWKWSPGGWSTVGLEDLRSRKQWAAKSARGCDWTLPGATSADNEGVLTDLTCRQSNDEGFSSSHLELISTIRYEKAGLEVQHVVWVFPDTPGIRTQMRAKLLPANSATSQPAVSGTSGRAGGGANLSDYSALQASGATRRPGAVLAARVDFLPLNFGSKNERLYWGYYKNVGQRHDQANEMLQEKRITGYPIFQPETIDWASAVAVDYSGSGVIAVKESPKCVNEARHETGSFIAGKDGLAVTGWGLTPGEIVPDRFREGWATWVIAYDGGDDGVQLALKQFSAARYPVFPQRDMFILANTWGPGDPWGERFSREDHVLKEIPAVAELGVDLLQIDDGWQTSEPAPDEKGFVGWEKSGFGPYGKSFRPAYEHGWTNIKAAADRCGLRLGLWIAIRNADSAQLKQNLDELGFVSWKADFEFLASRQDYETRFARLRDVMKHAWMKTQFTLCPEYTDPRYGWYFAQEYGSIYFQNIQEGKPAPLTMVPYHVLRNHWMMSKYFPANKLQVMLQNPKRTRKDLSDAPEHSHAYCFAMGLPFVPCFFQSAQYLDPQGKVELQKLIKVYKANREDIFTSLTFPIGDQPDNSNWAGFQMVSRQRAGGYLLLFRELHNAEASRSVKLKFLTGRTLEIEDLERGEKRAVQVAQDGSVSFTIDRPADYRFLKYGVK